MPTTKELFAQMGYISVTESAANTLTFAGLSVFSNVLGQKGMVIHRIEYDLPPATLLELSGEGDALIFGLSGTNSLTSILLDSPEIYDYESWYIKHIGTAAVALDRKGVVAKSYESLPGQGILVPADRLYAYLKGTGLGNPVNIKARFWYTILDLSAEQYLELAQSLRVLK